MSRPDIHRFEVIKEEGGLLISLTKKQSALFRALRAGEIVGDDALIAACWPGQAPHDNDPVRLKMLVSLTRGALAASRWRICRYRQRGYRLENELLVDDELDRDSGLVPLRNGRPPQAIEAA